MDETGPKIRDHTARRLAGVHVNRAVDEHLESAAHVKADGVLMVIGVGALALVIATIIAVIKTW